MVSRRLLNLPDYLGHVCDLGDEDFEVNASQLTKQVKHLATILNHFWRRWRSEYLNKLRESHCYPAKKTPNRPSLSKGDIIVHDNALPHGLWKLGQIQVILSSRDGLPQAALVRVASRDSQCILLRRSLQLLYPLEIHEAKTPDAGSEDAPASISDVSS